MSKSYWIGKMVHSNELNKSPYKRIVVGSCVQLTDGTKGEVRSGDLEKKTVNVKISLRDLITGIPAKDVVYVDHRECPVWARNGGRRRMRTRKHRKARRTRKIRR